MEKVASLFKRRLLRSEGAAGAPTRRARPEPAAAGPEHPPDPRFANMLTSRTRTSRSAGTSLPRQLSRLQHLDVETAGSRGSSVGRLSGGQATCRSTVTCCSCRWEQTVGRIDSGRRACRKSERRAVRGVASRHQRSEEAAVRSRRFRRAADRTRTRWCPIRMTGQHLRVRLRHELGAAGEELAGARATADEDPNTALFSIA